MLGVTPTPGGTMPSTGTLAATRTPAGELALFGLPLILAGLTLTRRQERSLP